MDDGGFIKSLRKRQIDAKDSLVWTRQTGGKVEGKWGKLKPRRPSCPLMQNLCRMGFTRSQRHPFCFQPNKAINPKPAFDAKTPSFLPQLVALLEKQAKWRHFCGSKFQTFCCFLFAKRYPNEKDFGHCRSLRQLVFLWLRGYFHRWEKPWPDFVFLAIDLHLLHATSVYTHKCLKVRFCVPRHKLCGITAEIFLGHVYSSAVWALRMCHLREHSTGELWDRRLHVLSFLPHSWMAAANYFWTSVPKKQNALVVLRQ